MLHQHAKVAELDTCGCTCSCIIVSCVLAAMLVFFVFECHCGKLLKLFPCRFGYTTNSFLYSELLTTKIGLLQITWRRTDTVYVGQNRISSSQIGMDGDRTQPSTVLLLLLLLLLLLKMYLFKWHCLQNAAGALYAVNKVPGYNIGGNSELATSGPENSSEKNVFSSRRKVVSDDAARTADGRLFHAHGAATENDRSPRVDRLTGGTIRVAVADERRWRRPSTSATRQILSARLDGAVPLRQRNVRTQSEPYPLWDAQPVEIAQKRLDTFRTLRWEDKSCGGVEDRLKSVQTVTRNAICTVGLRC